MLFRSVGAWSFAEGAFSGVAYAFDSSGRCLVEEEYVGGWETAESRRSWYPTGERESVVDGGDARAWFIDGRLQGLMSQGQAVYDLLFDDQDGALTTIVIEDRQLIDYDLLGEQRFGPKLSLMGEAIDGYFVRKLLQVADLSQVKELRISSSSIDAGVGELLRPLEQLEFITLEDNPAILREDVPEWRPWHQRWIVFWESERIELSPEEPSS